MHNGDRLEACVDKPRIAGNDQKLGEAGGSLLGELGYADTLILDLRHSELSEKIPL